MKTLLLLTTPLLASCIIGIDENGDWNLRTDPKVVDLAFDYVIRKEQPNPSTKAEGTVWAYQLEDGTWVDESGHVVPEWN